MQMSVMSYPLIEQVSLEGRKIHLKQVLFMMLGAGKNSTKE